VTYKISKSARVAYQQKIAIQNAETASVNVLPAR